ncbi:outer membrane beta-barrel protein [Helicobacter cetorum]|uniref:Outer membrane protein HorI n=1 Tax=Helicobacter cetorum (strain ATCC BAA-429 / MIT 00-7128) TaxID=182217 RepID=I0EP10_HELC0|nr:outer membrane beta-barrel protein [Helicobacter cetorum]AFI04679.1 outer membrane protein HorI [Helicobacter cetorum MIT 00-7128]
MRCHSITPPPNKLKLSYFPFLVSLILSSVHILHAETYEEMKERLTKEVKQEIAQKKAQEKAKEKALHDEIMQEELKKEVYEEELKKAQQQDKTPAITDTQAKPSSSHSQYEKIFSHQEVTHENVALKKEELNKDTQPKQQQIAPKPSELTPQKTAKPQTEKPLSYSAVRYRYEDRYDYADKDSFYLGIGYEYGSATTNGGDIVLGYKWVGDREETKWSGARVGVFASGSIYMPNIFATPNLNCIDPFNPCSISTSDKVNQALQDMNVGFSNYGVYSDWLINAYNGDRFFAGLMLGGALAGSTYFFTSQGGGVMGNFFQFFVNLGLRMGFSRHAFEFVAKLPTVTNKFDIEQGGYTKLKIPQNYLFGFNYVYSFK